LAALSKPSHDLTGMAGACHRQLTVALGNQTTFFVLLLQLQLQVISKTPKIMRGALFSLLIFNVLLLIEGSFHQDLLRTMSLQTDERSPWPLPPQGKRTTM